MDEELTELQVLLSNLSLDECSDSNIKQHQLFHPFLQSFCENILDVRRSNINSKVFIPIPEGDRVALIIKGASITLIPKEINQEEILTHEIRRPSSGTSILDCIRDKIDRRIIYVLDVIMLKGVMLKDSSIEARAYFLHTYVSHDLNTLKTLDLKLIPQMRLTADSLSSFLSSNIDYKLWGILTVNSDSEYILGETNNEAELWRVQPLDGTSYPSITLRYRMDMGSFVSEDFHLRIPLADNVAFQFGQPEDKLLYNLRITNANTHHVDYCIGDIAWDADNAVQVGEAIEALQWVRFEGKVGAVELLRIISEY